MLYHIPHLKTIETHNFSGNRFIELSYNCDRDVQVITNEILYCRLNIYCPQCDKKIINANERLLLQAVCTNCPKDVIEYDWTTHFVYKSWKFRPTQEKILCTIKLVDGSSFNLLRQASDIDTGNMYRSDTGDEADVKRGNNSVIHSSLFKNCKLMQLLQ